MKTIEIDDELYQYIASNTKFIGESASQILRRLLALDAEKAGNEQATSQPVAATTSQAVEAVTSQEEKTEPSIVADVSSKETVSTETTAKKKAKPAVSPVPSSVQNVFDLINKEELAAQRGAVGRFLLILSNLYRLHKKDFEQVLDIRGRDRLYFAQSEEELTESGSSTKPKQIPNSEYWVITNSNTTKKKRMLTDVAVALGYSASDAERIREMM